MNLTPLIVSFLVFYGIYFILSLSLNLEYGYAGLPNFGKVFFYSVGRVHGGLADGPRAAVGVVWAGGGSGLASSRWLTFAQAWRPSCGSGWRRKTRASWPAIFVGSLLLAAVLGGAAGYFLSYPALRVREVYLAMVLLIVAEISRSYVRANPAIACGAHGLVGIPNPLLWIDNPAVRGCRMRLSCLAIAGFMYFIAERLVDSPFGRVLKAVRDDELAAQVLGKRVAVVKGPVMAIGSAMAAVAGALYAFHVQFVGAEDFIPVITFNVLAMVILGGAANHKGVALGALVMTMVDRFSRTSFLALFGIQLPFDVNFLRYVIIGALLVALIMFRPQGLLPERPIRTPALEVFPAVALLEVRGLHKDFGGATAVAGVDLSYRGGGVCRPHRPQRQRQNDAVQLDLRRAAPDPGRGVLRRTAHRRAVARPHFSPGPRAQLSSAPPFSQHDDAGKRAAAAGKPAGRASVACAVSEAVAGARAGAGAQSAETCCRRFIWSTPRCKGRRSCRAGR